MIIRLDLQSEKPIYVQLVEQIIEGIASGRLKPGEPLPSVRSLAGDIGVNLHTVNKAYTLLRQEGYIQTHRRKGIVVQSPGAPRAADEYRNGLKRKLRSIVAEGICRGITDDDFSAMIREVYRDIKNDTGENVQ